ncbi:hypothetical protein H257_17187 [Aphanomyces astaci]|uniref:Myb-like domain-containing protein n=1 Tax=Aphanomyces astaci TaxID=112090 RepID=W4FHV3_APHAT|nr:hypothetical protein H257_17187 [Aphanomyces astaci]ETV66411.1 hypothetical protein H257_17187 [Aphanomyces astaci]RQM24085.1 hypothetical protein B5M09_001845 [Aphanomyces astaci]|eukprot:XP_009844186.1 hypothetical protein H257_17187 [Aphanomyces astaci]
MASTKPATETTGKVVKAAPAETGNDDVKAASTDAAAKGVKFGTSWSGKEDKKLKKAVEAQGKSHKANWKLVASKVPGRTAGACQGRWNTVLDPLVDRSPWTPELDAQLLELYKDPLYDSWSKRAAKLAEGKFGPDGKQPMRRSGADTCDRYFKITKSKKAPKTKGSNNHKKPAEVKWTDETDDALDAPPTIGQPTAAAAPVATRNQNIRARRNERRKKYIAAKAAAAADSNDDGAQEDGVAEDASANKKGKFDKNAGHFGKKPFDRAPGGKRKAASKPPPPKPFKKHKQ